MSHKNQPQNAENCCENRKCTCRMQLGVEWQRKNERKTDRSRCLSVSLVACNLYFVALAINVLHTPCSNKSAFKAYKVVVQSETFVYLA